MKKLGNLTFLCIYILEAILHYKFKSSSVLNIDLHTNRINKRYDFLGQQHRLVGFENPSRVHFMNKFSKV